MRQLTLSKGLLPLIKMGLLGVPGSGKTPTLATLVADPRLAPALWLDCGGNMEWVKRSGLIPYGVELERADDLDDVVEFMAMGQPQNHPLRAMVGVGKDVMFKSLVLDTGNRWETLALDELRAQKLANLVRKAQVRTPTPDQMRQWREDAQLEMPRDAGPIAERVRRTFMPIMSLPINVFISFHEAERMLITPKKAGEPGEGEASGIGRITKPIRPMWMGTTITEILGLLNLVGRINTGKEVEDKQVGNKMVKVEKPYSTILWQSDDAMVKNQVAPALLGTETKFFYKSEYGQLVTIILDSIEKETM